MPSLSMERSPWEYDTETYNERNEIECIFGRFKRFRTVLTHYDKTDSMFSASSMLPLIADLPR